jgi:hypothetical protein
VLDRQEDGIRDVETTGEERESDRDGEEDQKNGANATALRDHHERIVNAT